MSEVVIAVHGGAGRLAARQLRPSARNKYEAGLYAALSAGQNILLRGGSALRAVTEAVAVLEDDKLFNAGRGAALTADGTVELSASVMRGRGRAAGAVVGLKRTKNPVYAANALLGHSHILMFGAKADQYAEKRGLTMVPSSYFYTAARKRQLERIRERGEIALDHSEDAPSGTVGAVARDRRGSLAAATSTGGLVNQLSGRVGDTPVIGSGTWADNRVCAVSATGKGDAFFRVSFARRLADLVELGGWSIAEASRAALEEVKAVRGEGGCIVVAPDGTLAIEFNSSHMLRGWVRGRGEPKIGILSDEVIVVP